MNIINWYPATLISRRRVQHVSLKNPNTVYWDWYMIEAAVAGLQQ